MKQNIFTSTIAVTALSATLLLSSCGSYNAADGAFVGGELGHLIGSGIGAVTGGWKGEAIGSVIGTVGGAVAGAAIGASIDKAQDEKYQMARSQYQQGYANRNYDARRRQDIADTYAPGSNQFDDAIHDPQGRGNDVVDFGLDESNDVYGATYTLTEPHDIAPSTEVLAGFAPLGYERNPQMEIRNARFIDSNKDGALRRNEECKLVFEIMNNSDHPIFNVKPLVVNASHTKQVHISPSMNVEMVPPHRGVRFTATVLATDRLKDGELVLHIAAAMGCDDARLASSIQEFRIPTRKK